MRATPSRAIEEQAGIDWSGRARTLRRGIHAVWRMGGGLQFGSASSCDGLVEWTRCECHMTPLTQTERGVGPVITR